MVLTFSSMISTAVVNLERMQTYTQKSISLILQECGLKNSPGGAAL